jgi:hypothetical protein
LLKLEVSAEATGVVAALQVELRSRGSPRREQATSTCNDSTLNVRAVVAQNSINERCGCRHPGGGFA